MKKPKIFITTICLLLAATVWAPVAQAAMIGPSQNFAFGNTSITSNSIEVDFSSSSEHGSSGTLQWHTDVATNLHITFDYLITSNSRENNVMIWNDPHHWPGIANTLMYTDGLRHTFEGNVQLNAGTSFYLIVNEMSGSVSLGNITVATAGAGPVIDPIETPVTDPNTPPVTEPVAAPVPEPGTLVLLGAGLLGLAVFCKRRVNG